MLVLVIIYEQSMSANTVCKGFMSSTCNLIIPVTLYSAVVVAVVVVVVVVVVVATAAVIVCILMYGIAFALEPRASFIHIHR